LTQNDYDSNITELYAGKHSLVFSSNASREMNALDVRFFVFINGQITAKFFENLNKSNVKVNNSVLAIEYRLV